MHFSKQAVPSQAAARLAAAGRPVIEPLERRALLSAGPAAPEGGEFFVTSTGGIVVGPPSMASDATGDAIAVWPETSYYGGGSWSIMAQRFDPSGAKVGGAFNVSPGSTGRD